MIANSFFSYLELRWVNIIYDRPYVICITLMSTGSRRNQVPHFILPLITCCPALFSHIFFPAFYPLSLPHPALPLFTHTHAREVSWGPPSDFLRQILVKRLKFGCRWRPLICWK